MVGGIVDQGVWSLSNISLVVVTAKRSGLEDVGVMGLVVLLYVFGLGMVRACTGLSLIIRFSAVDHDERRRAAGSAVSAAAVLGLAGAVIFVAVGVIAGGRVRGPMLAVGVQFPLLMVQDVLRYYWLAERRAWRAAVTDGVWLVASLIGYPIVIVQGYGTAGMAFAWAAGASVSTAVDLAILRLPIAVKGHIHFARTNWDLTRPQIVEAVLQYGSSVLGVSLLGFVASLNAIGQIRLGQSLLGPLRTLLLGVAMAEVPETVHTAQRGARVLRRRIAFIAAGLSGIVFVSGLVIQAIPQRLGSVLLGQNWNAAQDVAVPLVLGFVGLALIFGPLVGLRALEQANVVVRCSFVQVVISTIGFVLGAVISDAIGAAVGQSAGLLIAAVVWWRAWLRASARVAAGEIPTASLHTIETVEELGPVVPD